MVIFSFTYVIQLPLLVIAILGHHWATDTLTWLMIFITISMIISLTISLIKFKSDPALLLDFIRDKITPEGLKYRHINYFMKLVVNIATLAYFVYVQSWVVVCLLVVWLALIKHVRDLMETHYKTISSPK